MKASRATQAILVGCGLLMEGARVSCHADDPAFSHRQFIADSFFLALLPNGKEWISVDGSTNLFDWTTVASVATTNSATIIHDPEARTFPYRFYRLRRDESAIADAKALWKLRVPGDYQFHLQHAGPVEFGPPYVFTGTVIVTSGRKAVINPEADGQPLKQPDPGAFPSVEELFAILQESYSPGCWRVAVLHDPKWGCPTWCAVERLDLGGWKRTDQYQITDVTVLGKAAGR